MDEVSPQQYWVRDDEGKRWGPLQASTLELLLPQKVFKGRLQASADGQNFVQIGAFPELREVLDEEWWGVDPKDVHRLKPPPGLPPPPDIEQQVAAASVALDPSALAPASPAAAGAAVDPSALAPGAALDPSALAPGAAVDPSALAPASPAAPGAALDPSALAPGAPVDPSALAPGAPLDPSTLAPASPAAAGAPLDPSALAPAPAPPPTAPEPAPDLSIPEQGELSRCSALRLAFGIAATRTTARVEFVGPGGVSVVHYRKGKPEHVASEVVDLGEWLVEKGHLDAAKKEQAAAAAPNFGGSFTAALFSQGLMDPGTGFQHLAAWAMEAYTEILKVVDGTFMVSLDVPPPPDAFPLGNNPYQPLVKAARLLSESEVRERLGPRLDAPAMITNVSGSNVEDLGLGPQETRLYPLFDGVQSPAQLAESQGDSGGTVLRLALLLAECRFLSFHGVVEDAPEAPAAPEPETPAEPASAESARDWSEEWSKARPMVSRVKKGDHFTVLGLKKGCTDEEVKAAFNQQIRAFHPDRAAGAPDDLQAAYRTIFDRVTEAYRAIDTDAKRRAYQNAQAEEALAKEAAQKAADAWDPIEELLTQKDYPAARDALNQMISENPGNAGAYGYLAWVTVLSADDRQTVAAKALELVTRAMSTDPTCGVAFLNAARIAKAYGDKESMRQYLSKARALGAKIKTKKKKA